MFYGPLQSSGDWWKVSVSATLLSYSDIQWLFPTDLCRLFLFIQPCCTSGVGNAGFLSAEQRMSQQLATDLIKLLLAL